MIMCTSKMQKNPYENVIAVTNRSLCQRPFAEQIERVCSLHPKAVILREKDLPETSKLSLIFFQQKYWQMNVWMMQFFCYVYIGM